MPVTNQLPIVQHSLINAPEITPRAPVQSNPNGEVTLTGEEMRQLFSDPSLTEPFIFEEAARGAVKSIINGFNPSVLSRSPSSFVPESFSPKYENPQGFLQQASNFNHDLAGYLGYTQAALSLAANWLTLGSLANFKLPSKPVQSNPNPNRYSTPVKRGFDSHKPIIRNYLEGLPLPQTIRPSIHGTQTPYQPTSPNRVPTGNRWHNPNIGTPSQGLIRRALEGFPRRLPDIKNFPFHDVGKWYKPSSNFKLPKPPC